MTFIRQNVIKKESIRSFHDLEDKTELSLSVVGSTLFIKEAGSIADHIASFGLDSNLLVPEPYDDLYIHYLDQRIAYNNNDTRRYNAAAQQYNNALLTYQQYFNRNYTTIKTKKRLFRHENL